ncbi:MAG: hypothetical protein U0470_05815 [Anaerolineae bacterium]
MPRPLEGGRHGGGPPGVRHVYRHATDVAGYLRESILEPGAFIVPGNAAWGTTGKSLMPVKGGATLSDGDVAMIVDYLVTLSR